MNSFPYKKPPIAPRGVRKASELIVQKGRSLIFTEEDATKLEWSEIPDGALKINPETGIMQVKLEGETDWVPAGIKNDGTICIAKDTKIMLESFTILEIDEEENTFVYQDVNGQRRHSIMIEDKEKETLEFVFELILSDYMMNRNVLNVRINDTLIRSAATGGLHELSNKRFSLFDNLQVGDVITVCYGSRLNIGNPYPRFFIGPVPPEKAENYDFWLDTNPAPYFDDIIIGKEIEDITDRRVVVLGDGVNEDAVKELIKKHGKSGSLWKYDVENDELVPKSKEEIEAMDIDSNNETVKELVEEYSKKYSGSLWKYDEENKMLYPKTEEEMSSINVESDNETVNKLVKQYVDKYLKEIGIAKGDPTE